MATRRKKLKKRISQMQQQADEAMQQAQQRYDDLEARIPTREDLLGGMPTQSQVQDIAPVDPNLQAAQDFARQQMMQVAQQGFTPQHQAALDASLRQANLNERAQRDAIMQGFRARGMGGSGMALAGALAAQQGEANRSADTAAQLGMAAMNRSYGAAQDLGQFAGSQDAQRFGQQMGRSSALDQFNMQLAGARGGATQQQWGNQFGLAGAQSGVDQQRAGYYGQQGQQAQGQLQQMNQNLWGGIQGAIGSIAPMANAFKGAGSTQPQQGWGSGTYRGTPGGR